MKKRRPNRLHGTSGAGKAPASPKATEPASTRKGWGAAPILAVGVLVLGAAVFFVAAFEDTTVESGLQPASDLSASAYNLGNQAAKPFPYYDSVEEARPFPVTLPPTTYENETLQTTYAIAKEIPEVLVQLPCLCGCHGASEDHGSLLDCYVDNHAAT
ncbi:MAG: hypothetical protein OXE58_12940 [Acidobacteria bacterium]|nr:hypothetical protein [Acidobacteriota bacterium]